VIRLARSFVAVALCAQLAHAVLYQSVLPRTGPHAYFSWYLPALTAAVVAALVALPVSVRERGEEARRSIVLLLPQRRAGRAVGDVWRLALASGVYFFIQESLERTAESGSFRFVGLSALSWLTLALTLVVAAFAVITLEHTLADLVVRPDRRRLPRAARTQSTTIPATGPRPRPLTVHGALRAPPLTV
jgi:predicted outer membrane lipoprotein